jgi:hypothetical protein
MLEVMTQNRPRNSLNSPPSNEEVERMIESDREPDDNTLTARIFRYRLEHWDIEFIISIDLDIARMNRREFEDWLEQNLRRR